MYIPISTPNSVLRAVGWYFSTFSRTFCKQTVETLMIRCPKMRHLIWICTVCPCPTKKDARYIWVKRSHNFSLYLKHFDLTGSTMQYFRWIIVMGTRFHLQSEQDSFLTAMFFRCKFSTYTVHFHIYTSLFCWVPDKVYIIHFCCIIN